MLSRFSAASLISGRRFCSGQRPLWLLWGLMIVLAGCSQPRYLTVLGTNDHHGHYLANRQGEYGLAARLTLVKKIRQEVTRQGGTVLLLSAGDINTGPPESTLLQAKPDIIGMNLLGYNAMTIGNHEFDQPLATLLQQQKLARFPFLSANIFHKRNEKPAFTPYIIKDIQGVKVGIIGLTTPDTPQQSAGPHTRELIFRDPIAQARHLLGRLRRQTDMIIALTHLGYYPGGQHGQNAPGDVTLARQTRGLNYIVGGHTHTALAKPATIGPTLISQAGQWGRFISRADFIIHKGQVRLTSYRLIPINHDPDQGNARPDPARPPGNLLPEDPMMLALLAPYRKSVEARLDRVVGRLDAVFDGRREHIRRGPTSLGNLITTVMRRATRADAALINSGSIRDSLPAGTVTLRDLLKMHPFHNTICTIQLSGAEIRAYLEYIHQFEPGTGAFPQTSGLAATYQAGRLQHLKIQDQPVVPEKLYKVAVNSFIARGNDGYPDLREQPFFLNTGLTLSQALIKQFQQTPLIRHQDHAPSPEK